MCVCTVKAKLVLSTNGEIFAHLKQSNKHTIKPREVNLTKSLENTEQVPYILVSQS